VTLPTFLILGAAKSGTTSLFGYLAQHPEVFVPRVKEPQFFGFAVEKAPYASPDAWAVPRWRYKQTLETYKRLFEGAETYKARGEASTTNLVLPHAAEQIHRTVPDAKLIAILRNPADRAYSHFLNNRRQGWEPARDFAQALAAEDARIARNWSYGFRYRAMGRYYHQLTRFLDKFSREQIRIYLYDEWKKDNPGVVKDIFRFIGVDPAFTADVSIRMNEGLLPRWQPLYRGLTGPVPVIRRIKHYTPEPWRRRFVHRLFRSKGRAAPPCPRSVRDRLIPAFKEDNLKLQDLLDRDLSSWLTP